MACCLLTISQWILSGIQEINVNGGTLWLQLMRHGDIAAHAISGAVRGRLPVSGTVSNTIAGAQKASVLKEAGTGADRGGPHCLLAPDGSSGPFWSKLK